MGEFNTASGVYSVDEFVFESCICFLSGEGVFDQV